MVWLIALFEFDYVCSDHITFVKVFFVYEALHGSPTLLEIGCLCKKWDRLNACPY